MCGPAIKLANDGGSAAVGVTAYASVVCDVDTWFQLVLVRVSMFGYCPDAVCRSADSTPEPLADAGMGAGPRGSSVPYCGSALHVR